MHIFAYSRGWADLTVAQLAAAANTESPELWGYACLCIGRKFDDMIEELYPEIDRVTGQYLHVFTMFPPPKRFLEDRIARLDSANHIPANSCYAKERLQALLMDRNTCYAYNRRDQIEEKETLLQDLQKAGVRVDQYVDFLFFDFRKQEEGVDIDVIAAKATPVPERPSSYQVVDFFGKMRTAAAYHYKRRHGAQEFVKDLALEWDLRIALKKTFDLSTYIKGFLKPLFG